MWLRDEDGDRLASARGMIFGLVIGLVCWALAFFGVLGLMGNL